MATRKAIIGIGNPLMTDDGIGIVLLNRFQARDDIQGFSFIDQGTGGMTLLHHLSRLDRVLIIDSGNMGIDPGEYRLFSPEEATTVKFLPGESLHEFDLLRAIELSKQLGEYPEKLFIFAIQPKSIAWGQELSEEVSSRIGDYENGILAALEKLQD